MFPRFPWVCKPPLLSRFPLFTDAFGVVCRLPDHPAAYQRRFSALVTFRCTQRSSAAPAILYVSLVPSVGLHLAARVPDILQHVHGPQRRTAPSPEFRDYALPSASFRALRGTSQYCRKHSSILPRFPGTSGPSPPCRATEVLLDLRHRRARRPSPVVHRKVDLIQRKVSRLKTYSGLPAEGT